MMMKNPTGYTPEGVGVGKQNRGKRLFISLVFQAAFHWKPWVSCSSNGSAKEFAKADFTGNV